MKNKVELLGHYGSDEIIACSAWTSTSRDLTENKRGRINKLIDKKIMGEIFKVMLLTNNKTKFNIGFKSD